MAIKQKRDKGIKVMVTEVTFQRLHELGELLGQSPSTLASMGVSNLVNQYMGQIAVQDKAIKAMTEMMSPQVTEQMKLAEAMSK
jgi:hypothetical protein